MNQCKPARLAKSGVASGRDGSGVWPRATSDSGSTDARRSAGISGRGLLRYRAYPFQYEYASVCRLGNLLPRRSQQVSRSTLGSVVQDIPARCGMERMTLDRAAGRRIGVLSRNTDRPAEHASCDRSTDRDDPRGQLMGDRILRGACRAYECASFCQIVTG